MDKSEVVWRDRAGGGFAAATYVAAAAVWAVVGAGLLAFAAWNPTLMAGAGALAVAVAVLCLIEAAATGLVVVRISAHSIQIRPVLLWLGGVRVPLREIRAARVVDAAVRPWGSWGWWWRPRPTRILIRSGPSLGLTLESGRELVISVNHPDAAARMVSVVKGH